MFLKNLRKKKARFIYGFLLNKNLSDAYKVNYFIHSVFFIYVPLPSWSWSYGNWIYNYLCNQCLSSPTLWVPIPLRRDVLDTTLCDKVCNWLATVRWVFPGNPISSTNKTDRHDIAEILLKVALNIITLTLTLFTHQARRVSSRVYMCYIYRMSKWLTPNEQFSAIIWKEHVTFWCDDDDDVDAIMMMMMMMMMMPAL